MSTIGGGAYPEGFREFLESQRKAQEAMTRVFMKPDLSASVRASQEHMRKLATSTSFQSSLADIQKSVLAGAQMQKLIGSVSVQSLLPDIQKNVLAGAQMKKLINSVSVQSSLRDIQNSVLVGEQLKKLVEGVSIQSSLPSFRGILSAQQMLNSGSLTAVERAMQQFDKTHLEQMGRAIRGIEIGLAADVEDALNHVIEPIASEIDVELPDGLSALPIIVATLPASQRLGLMLRLVTLIVATSLYIDALAEERNQFIGLVATLLANFWLYASVLAAIEHAEDELSED